MINPETLRSGGALPTGPCSAWPLELHVALMEAHGLPIEQMDGVKNGIDHTPRLKTTVGMSVPTDELEARAGRPRHAKKVKAGLGQMAKGLVSNVGQAIVNGKVSEEIRNERYDTCKACPFFIEDSKRCSECGCFMEAKTWIGGDPDMLCPKQKWSR